MKLSLALMLMTATTVVAADDLFSVDIVSHPDNVLLGIAHPMVGRRASMMAVEAQGTE